MFKTAHTDASRIVNRIAKIRASTTLVINDSGLRDLLVKRTKSAFRNGVSPDGEKWPALKKSTIDRKIRAKSTTPGQPLRRTGLLYDAIRVIKRTETTLASATGAGFSIGVEPYGAEGGNPAVYGRFHQFGTKGPHGVTKRRFLGMSSLDIRAVNNHLQNVLRKQLQGV